MWFSTHQISTGVWNYTAVDSWQRSILLLDTLRERGDNYVERAPLERCHVLSFPAELITRWPHPGASGELSARAHRSTRQDRDPILPSRRLSSSIRAPACSPGIGGMKSEKAKSGGGAEGGSRLLLHRVPAQSDARTGTIEDVCRAEERSLSGEIAARHPDAEGKPDCHRQLSGQVARP